MKKAYGLIIAIKGFISPTHKRTEGRAPVWGSEFNSKDFKNSIQFKTKRHRSQ